MGIGKKMFILLSFSSSPYQPQKMLHIVRTKKKKKSHLPNGIRNNFMKKKINPRSSSTIGSMVLALCLKHN